MVNGASSAAGWRLLAEASQENEALRLSFIECVNEAETTAG
jgi:hypothetical protein